MSNVNRRIPGFAVAFQPVVDAQNLGNLGRFQFLENGEYHLELSKKTSF